MKQNEMTGTSTRRAAFTLVELLVVVAIIGILISILVTVGSSVNKSAGVVATKGRMQSLDTGLQSYRNERELGGSYPPSRTDNNTSTNRPDHVLRMANPFALNASDTAIVSGASLLTYAMVGPDQLGTAGFFDHNNMDGWWDDMHADPNVNAPGAYGLEATTAEPMQRRFPGGGTTYVDDQTRESIRSLARLEDEGVIVASDRRPMSENGGAQLTFTDNWERPILYFRANPAGRTMITEPDVSVGVYDARDNAILTGNQTVNYAGVDFGPGYVGPQEDASLLAVEQFPPLKPVLVGSINQIETDDTYEGSFARYIHDKSVTHQNRPVNANTFLLISAGPDAIYGTLDDVVNWERGE